MRWLRWIPALIVLTVIAGWLHYTLPDRDIVRIVNTDTRRVDFGENAIFWAGPDAGAAGAPNRDVRFIEAVRPNGRPMVYRNEDTGWGWPPYFKLDSSNLQTEARDLVSTAADPRWVAVTHYGWRSELLSIFPNAVAVRVVDGPDVRLIPWFNIVVLTLLAALAWGVGVRIRRFRRNRIDPLIEDAGEAWDDAGEAVTRRGRGLRRWFRGR